MLGALFTGGKESRTCQATPFAQSQASSKSGVSSLQPKLWGPASPSALRPTAGPQSFHSCQRAHGSSGSLPSWPGLQCVVNRRVALWLLQSWERGIRAGNCCVKMTAQQFIHPKQGPSIPRGCRQLGINTAPEEGLLGRKGGSKDPYGSDDYFQGDHPLHENCVPEEQSSGCHAWQGRAWRQGWLVLLLLLTIRGRGLDGVSFRRT